MKKVFFIISFMTFFVTASTAEETILARQILKDEKWSGTVKIKGIVAVKKGVTLTIEPGTRVEFAENDVDGDGIGDSELYIEGAIISKGEQSKPIIFTSASGKPKKSSWKYVMANHSSHAEFSNCIFEGAFSGLQVHFSNAMVTDCIFRMNVDGFRFSTSKILLTRNIMVENTHGIRYEERDSSGIMCANDVTGNEIGIFPVTRCTGKVVFRRNNIYNNQVNVKVGYDQGEGLSYGQNFWGSLSDASIRKTICDKNYDGTLAEVTIKPIAKQRINKENEKCVNW